MRLLTLFIALSASSLESLAVEYRLPFDGRWFVIQGGDTLNVNHHVRVSAQRYAIDFVKAGGENGRALSRPGGTALTDSYSWGQPVLAPTAGEVIVAVDTFPDNPLGTKDTRNPEGNLVVIKAAPDAFVFLAHLQKGSVTVKAGDKVVAGQLLGLCGNSGNSDAPHVHLHVQDSSILNESTGQNIIFHGINVELTGKQFERVDWPVIRGLWVSQGSSSTQPTSTSETGSTQIDPKRPELTRDVRPAIFKEQPIGTMNVGLNGLEARWYNYGPYLHHLIQTIEDRWDNLIKEAYRYPRQGSTVTVKFTLNSKGVVSAIRRAEGNGEKFGTELCVSAVDPGKDYSYGVWSDEMISVLGSEQELTFTFFYR